MLKLNHYLSLALLFSIPVVAMDMPEINSAQAGIFSAIRSGNLNQLRTLEQAHKNIALNRINQNGMPLLVITAINGTPEIMHYLLRTARLNPNINYNGQNLLHIAAAHNRLNMVKYLIEVAKFDINAKNDAGQSVLDIAKQKKYEGVINYLVAIINSSKITKKYQPRPTKEIIFDELETDDFINSQKPVTPQPAVKPARPLPKLPAKAPAKPVTKSCTICFEDQQPNQFVKLDCGHEYCKECLANIFDGALKDKSTRAFKCPTPNCNHLLENDAQKISNDQKKHEQLSDIQLQEWLTKQEAIKNCPTPNCGFSFINERADQFTMQCPDCKKEYCGKCLHIHNPRVSCQQAEQDRNLAQDKNAQERENAKWLKSHTRACPKCKASIEKNEGCNHMTCKKCYHEFCWLCLTNWYGHNWQICQANQVEPLAQQHAQPQEQEEQITFANAHLFFARDPRGFVTTVYRDLHIGIIFAERFMRLACEAQGEWAARITQLLENDEQNYVREMNNHWHNELAKLEPFSLRVSIHMPTQEGTFVVQINSNREFGHRLQNEIQEWIIDQYPQELIIFKGWINRILSIETSLSSERLQEILDQASRHFKNHPEAQQAPAQVRPLPPVPHLRPHQLPQEEAPFVGQARFEEQPLIMHGHISREHQQIIAGQVVLSSLIIRIDAFPPQLIENYARILRERLDALNVRLNLFEIRGNTIVLMNTNQIINRDLVQRAIEEANISN